MFYKGLLIFNYKYLQICRFLKSHFSLKKKKKRKDQTTLDLIPKLQLHSSYHFSRGVISPFPLGPHIPVVLLPPSFVHASCRHVSLMCSEKLKRNLHFGRVGRREEQVGTCVLWSFFFCLFWEWAGIHKRGKILCGWVTLITCWLSNVTLSL